MIQTTREGATLRDQRANNLFTSESGKLGYNVEAGVALLEVTVDNPAVCEAVAPLLESDEQALRSAVKHAGLLPEVREVERLQKQIDDTLRERAELMLAGNAAVEQSRRSLECGDDPSQHEQAAVEARRQIEVRDARLTHLQKLLVAAERVATRATKTAMESVWQALLESHRQRRADALERLEGALKLILTELAAIDQAEANLYDPISGGPPNWATVE
jgi:hypothetical protein